MIASQTLIKISIFL